MTANIQAAGNDLDNIFDPLGGLTARAAVNIQVSGTDIASRYAPASEGTAAGTTGITSSSSDIGPLFAALGTVPWYPGTLYITGAATNGALGDNSTITKSSPVQTASGGTNWKIAWGSVNSFTTTAIKSDGSLWLWGLNSSGEIGDNTLTNRSSPVQTISGGTNWAQVLIPNGSMTSANAGAIKTDGSFWLWGGNFSGQLGINTTVDKTSPVQTISGGTNYKQAAAGGGNWGTVKTDGSLWTWGSNTNGVLGNNAGTTARSSPVQTVAAGTNWSSYAAGGNVAAAIKTDGTLWSWGNGSGGLLGNNASITRSSPVQTVSGGTNWKNVTVNNGSMAATKTDGSCWAWGSNALGGVGDNTSINKSSPVQTASGGTNWKNVSGQSSLGGIKTDGTLWVWGYNLYGELNLSNSTINRSSPIQYGGGGTSWKRWGSGGSQTYAIS